MFDVESMLKNGFILLLLILSLMACENTSTPLERAAQAFLQEQDVKSLRRLAARMQRGMSRHDVEALLGQPVFSPLPRQYHYATTDSHVFVLDYRNKGGEVTDTLQGFWIARADP
jgi:phosphoserine phosphatase